MIRSATISVVFHLAVAGALALDLPSFADDEPVNAETIITVSYETVGPETNLKTAGEPEETAPDEPISAPDQQRQAPPETAPPPPPPPVEAETADVAPLPEPVPAPEPEAVAPPPPPPAPRPVVELDPDGTLAPRKPVEEKVEKLAKLEPLPVPEPRPVEREPEPARPEPPAPEIPKPRPQEVAKAAPVPDARPQKKPDDQEALFDRLSAKLDRLNKEKPTPPVEKNQRRISDIRIGEGGTARNRVDAVLTVSERDLLRSHMARNWSPNHGAPGIQEMRADIHLFLNKDGTLAREPELVEVHDAGQNSRVVQAFTDSAVRAVYKAQPLPMPPEKFEQWREMVFTFSLREVYGQ